MPRSEVPEAWEILADFRGNSARRWRRWHWLIFAVIVTLWLPVPPPSNGYTPAARWLAAAAGEE